MGALRQLVLAWGESLAADWPEDQGKIIVLPVHEGPQMRQGP